MRLLIQRVNQASVTIGNECVGSIKKGFLVLVGIADSDSEAIADRMIRKMTSLRIFEDAEGKTNLGLREVEGSLLLVSQFTLYADCRRGNRPSFTKAGEPVKAKSLFDHLCQSCRQLGFTVETGRFGEEMKVDLQNDGPFTVWLDSEELAYK